MLKLKPDVCENGGDSHSDDEGIQFVNKGDNQDNIGIGQGVGTIQWFTEEGNIYITIKDRDGVCEKETIPVQKITNFKSFMEENHEDLSMFDRLNRDFNINLSLFPELVRNRQNLSKNIFWTCPTIHTEVSKKPKKMQLRPS